MLSFPNSGGILLEDKSELPNYSNATELIADFETSSGDPKETSVNPWHHCSIAGLAIRAADDHTTYYVPDELLDRQWVKDTFHSGILWTNHNVKYDANVMANCADHHFRGRFFDTVVGAKLVNSDRWSYSLEALSKDWLKLRKRKDLLAPYLYTISNSGSKLWHNKDYGRIPAFVLGDYACSDVDVTLELAKTIRKYMPAISEGIFNTECELTRILFDAEQRGLQLAPHAELELRQAKTLTKLLKDIFPKLQQLTEFDGFEPHNSDHCHQVFHEEYNLPILDFTEEGNPSYNKHVLKQYLAIPEEGTVNGKKVKKGHTELVKLSLEWKKLWQFNNLYLETYLALGVDDIIHPDFNQCVKTGRMSCRRPNMQQLDKAAKSLIRARPGHVLLSMDYSQVEFRIIVHYIQNRYALQAYEEDPDTDFHTWVAEMVGIPRRPAKNVNFMLGYGGGKKKTLSMLQDQPDLMNEIRGTCDSDEAFTMACRIRASEVFSNYHATLPELKQTSALASTRCRKAGFVRDLYGRVRKLPGKAAHKAFNNVCQASAADLAKERAVALVRHLEGQGSKSALLALVHDEFLVEVPEQELSPEFVRSVLDVLESPSVPLRVPIRCSAKVSTGSWADAKPYPE